MTNKVVYKTWNIFTQKGKHCEKILKVILFDILISAI